VKKQLKGDNANRTGQKQHQWASQKDARRD
jgi:hypothetical protein